MHSAVCAVVHQVLTNKSKVIFVVSHLIASKQLSLKFFEVVVAEAHICPDSNEDHSTLLRHCSYDSKTILHSLTYIRFDAVAWVAGRASGL